MTWLEEGNDPAVRAIAEQVIESPTVEKAELAAWLESHTPAPDAEGQAFNAEMMKVIEKMKNWKDVQVLTGDADNDFAALMIVHHHQATDNAQSILHRWHHDHIEETAKMMIVDQIKK